MPAGKKKQDQDVPVKDVLRNYELRYRMMAKNVTMGMFQLTPIPGSRILSTNPVMAQMLGYDNPKELVGKPLGEIVILPADLEDLASGIQKEGSYKSQEIRLARKDGTEVWVSVQAWNLHVVGSPVPLIEGFIEDITERRIFEQEMHYHESELNRYAHALAQANRKLNLLASISRHDLLNQLTALIATNELMENQYQDENLAAYIRRQGAIARKIEEQVLFTKDYHEIGVSSPLWYDVRKGIEVAAAALSLPPGILTIDHSAAVLIYADPLVEKVFYNLMENALRHGNGITRITFSSYIDNGTMVLVCEDNGGGVPAQYKEAIFTRQHFTHTGLGLFLSREILGITGLSVCETGEPGKGARFEITVPQESYRFDPAVR
jgi:PAS domain S-box-containing protein